MRKLGTSCLLILLAALGVQGLAMAESSVASEKQSDDLAAASEPDPRWAQGWLDSGYFPRHLALTRAADQLAASSAALCAQPDAAALASARQAWLATSTAWRALDGAPAGPMVLARLGRKIDFRPLRLPELNSAIAGGEGNVAAQGLAAVEYLLWGDERAAPKVVLAGLKAASTCHYLQRISADIARETHALDDGWQLYRSQLGADNPFFRQNMFSEHVNLMLASLTSLGKRVPTGSSIEASQLPEWRSGSAKVQMLAQLQGVSAASAGIAEYLQRRDEGRLAAALQDDLQQARQLCSQLADPLDKASASSRLACNKSISQIKKRLQDEVAEKLDLTLGFTEGDGD
ncbi:imelysin family protein [Chitinibacter sp. FCG-7]|uniref:Imelysin family protein n=1 Tax=Chitinibacter mangrovi TaxID=3153927 RepID=A0AAU7F993_9NEIS